MHFSKDGQTFHGNYCIHGHPGGLKVSAKRVHCALRFGHLPFYELNQSSYQPPVIEAEG